MKCENCGNDNYPNWIPVSERLPEEPKENPIFDGEKAELYLVTDMCKEYPVMALWNGKCFANGWHKMCVTAWMPMPEPYQESEGK